MQAELIKTNRDTARGTKTHKITWRNYMRWHSLAFRSEAPHCDLTGCLWINRETGARFMQWMAVTGKTRPLMGVPH
eukprot:1998271-Prymnesium_polylepis.1